MGSQIILSQSYWGQWRDAPTKQELKIIALLQRVSQARVEIGGQVVGQIDSGLLVFLCAEQGDGNTLCDRMVAKILKLRIFSDAAGKMNLSLLERGQQGKPGGLLVVSQFTLAADVSSGNRPGFSAAAAPDEGRRLYEYFVAQARNLYPVVQTGQFGADMQIHLVNDGPVTIPLRMSMPQTQL